jgi:SAM-dependent methyltransferase
VRPAVRDELLRINRAFYQSLAAPFAATRTRPQPGVRRLLDRIDRSARVLDVGCGHGLVAGELLRLGHKGLYDGLDASQPLLGLARRRVEATWVTFAIADVAQPDWRQAVSNATYDWVMAFAVLHHIPDASLRRQVATEFHLALAPEGRAAVSVWDFAGNERFRRRIVPWEEVGLTAAEVEPGDTLLDWRGAGRGIRYVHHFTSQELRELALAAGLSVAEEFHADGEGGRLGLYQLWQV